AHPQKHGNYCQPFPLSPEQHCSPRFFCWDHISHKGFSPPLSRPRRFEANARKSWRELESNSIQVLCNRNLFKCYALTGAPLVCLRKSACAKAALTACAWKGKAKGGIRGSGYRLKQRKDRRVGARSRLPHANALFERLRILCVGELQREAFLEIAHHPRRHA